MAGELNSTELEMKGDTDAPNLSLDSHPMLAVMKSPADNYEDVAPLQTTPEKGHLTTTPNKATYQTIDEALLDSNTKPVSIYTERAPLNSELMKETCDAAKDTKGQNEEWKYKVIKRMVLTTVIILVLLFLVVVCLSLCLVFILGHLKSPAIQTCDSNFCDLASFNASYNQFMDATLLLTMVAIKNLTHLQEHIVGIENLIQLQQFIEGIENFTELQERIGAVENLIQLSLPVDSCASLLPSFPSGYYWVRTSNGSAVRVHCDMTLSCDNFTGGWTRVAQLNVTDNSTQCPGDLRPQNRINNIVTCGIDTTQGPPNCSSTTFSTTDIMYSSVCGRIAAYQFGHPVGCQSVQNIDDAYIDGVSLTYGSPRQHIWTFAASTEDENCHCSDSSSNKMTGFIGSDYFCDGVNTDSSYSTNSLWDGVDCDHSIEHCTFNNPPWFYNQLSQPTSEDIEMRVCKVNSDDIGIAVVEIYVQ